MYMYMTAHMYQYRNAVQSNNERNTTSTSTSFNPKKARERHECIKARRRAGGGGGTDVILGVEQEVAAVGELQTEDVLSLGVVGGTRRLRALQRQRRLVAEATVRVLSTHTKTST